MNFTDGQLKPSGETLNETPQSFDPRHPLALAILLLIGAVMLVWSAIRPYA